MSHLFFNNVVRLWGVPLSTISDRDPRFTSKFWTELFKFIGTRLLMSMSYHPQIDWQTKRVNALLEDYLRHIVSGDQKNWTMLLEIAQFSYNLQKSGLCQYSPFELATGQQTLTLHTLLSGYHGSYATTVDMVKRWKDQVDSARYHLTLAGDRMEKIVNHIRRELEFSIGDKVLLRMNPDQFKAPFSMSSSLVRSWDGLFEVVAKVGKVAYKLNENEAKFKYFKSGCLNGK